ncbi:hypothetical protein QBC36DRAFT_355247 [Triangularia setosa]|uniref:Suppressor of anucleate metulae protein B n=1 Tax=Triangularia setosa TaxID=2587417 RepID=A0AAN6W575_9PEZI|nr:hypothetical protein QBC36DRAFT_355247 [Podospora setosa]
MDELTASLARQLATTLPASKDMKIAFSLDNNNNDNNNNNNNNNDDDDNDFGCSPPREGFNTEPKLWPAILSRENVTASAPLEIRSSTFAPGSGLFIGRDAPILSSNGKPDRRYDGIEAGREIYRSKPLMVAFEGGDEGWCHFCWRDTEVFLKGRQEDGQEEGKKEGTKVCMGCRVARFCSKQCQKSAWTRFHREECKVLRKTPRMKPQNLLAHRLVWFQQKGYITTEQGAVIERLETHFDEYTREEGGKTTEVYDIAMAVREVTGEAKGKKIDFGLIWRLVPALRTNCVRLRAASPKDTVAFALDIVAAMINHSCKPNAFAFLEKGEIRVRSLKKITPGEEISICYIDPTIDAKSRQEILMDEHFFECDCTRCKAEIKLQKRMVAGDGETSMATLRKAQLSILTLMKSAVTASRYPGVYKDFENLSVVESQMLTFMKNAFPNIDWRADLDPVPMARICLSVLYIDQGKPSQALRNAFRGQFTGGPRRTNPDAVNILVDMVHTLMAAGCLPLDSPVLKDTSFPTLLDISNVTYGFLHEACKEAGEVFGGDCEYTKAICDLFAKMMGKLPSGSSRPPEEKFAKEFEASLKKLLEWAGITTGKVLEKST